MSTTLFNLTDVDFVTAFIMRNDGLSFTYVARPGKSSVWINHQDLSVEHVRNVQTEELCGHVTLRCDVKPTPENFPFSSMLVTNIVAIDVLEN